MSNPTSKTTLYDAGKCITSILVVIAHATRMYTPNGAVPVANESPFLNGLTDYIYAFHMPLFIMLSGCVFGYCIEKQKYRELLPFLKNKGKRLLIPYFVFGIFYVAPVMCLLKLTDNSYLRYIFDGIICSYNSRHLWFMLALFWIFTLYILLRPLLLKGNRELILCGFISLVFLFASKQMGSICQLSAACSNQIYFFLGILFNRFYPQVTTFFFKYRALCLLLPAALTGVLFFNPSILTAQLYSLIGITMAMFLFWYLLRLCPTLTELSFYRCIKKNAFAIYLFHLMIIYLLFHLLGQYHVSPLLLSGFISIIAITMSIGAAELMRRLHLHLIIGE